MPLSLADTEELEARSAMRAGMWSDLGDVPTVMPWHLLRALFIDAVSAEFERWIGREQAHFHDQLLFATGRFDEGAGLVRYFTQFAGVDRDATVLDIGAGNGGVAFAFANCTRFRVHTLDIVPNAELVSLRNNLPVTVRPLVASGSAIPMQSASVDIILLLDTIEHMRERDAVGREIMRVLRPGGVCMITTPARLRHLLGRDPHYGIRFLVMFPNAVQRFIVNEIFRRRVREQAAAYDVEHIFWHVDEVASLFPGKKAVDVLYNRAYHPPGPFTRAWIRHPSLALEATRYSVRRYFWDRIVIRKE